MEAYHIKRILQPLEIDGNLTKEAWQHAEAVELYDTVTGCSPVQPTKVRLLWDKNFLYVAFECVDTYINATKTAFNDTLYEEEVIEIFIDDNRDLKSYTEIEVNPLNAVLHYMILNQLNGIINGYARLENNIKSSVLHLKDSNLICYEIAIPFCELATAPNMPPKRGDKWLMNLYRIDRPLTGHDEYSAWSPTGKLNFHIPQSFGEVTFE